MGIYTALVIICFLPYATLPVKVGLTFTLLEAVMLLTIAVWILRFGFDRNEVVITSPLFVPLTFFVVATLIAFLVGTGRNTTTQTAHDYLKLLLGVGMAIVVPNLIRDWPDVRAFVATLLAGGASAALLAILLQKLPIATTTNLLARLQVVGYPTSRIIRYIEDNPDLSRRATGTSVDPNSFAGLLMLILVLAVGQAVARRPVIPRWLPIVTVPPTGVALLMTQSRAALYGAALGVLVLAIARYRWLLGPLALLGLVVLIFERGSEIVARFLAGVRGQDAATRLRFREFGNALQLIRDYPIFGVGFGDAPRIDLQTGVSSVYLTVAERAGLIGLALFLVLLAVLLTRSFRGSLHARPDDPTGELLLAVASALVAACAAALLDHYFFNLGFPHMAALFWALAGLSEVLLRRLAPSPDPSPARRGRGVLARSATDSTTASLSSSLPLLAGEGPG
jgi:O-antigen ligase